ncbi:MAG: DUF4149 domain-containing protein [Candidatus Limnocylindria bacterium]|nr:DUF4149 domain-containing protein [Candidatus Limnocylindria bacterium]
METTPFDLLKLGYHLGLAVIVGGSLVLGAAAAPAIFATAKTRGEGGTLFGNILARYDGLAILALLVVALTTVLKALGYETVAPPIVARWIALAVMGAATLYASAWANPIARALRAATEDWDSLPETSPQRREFMTLHRRSRRAMSIAVLAGIVALFFS